MVKKTKKKRRCSVNRRRAVRRSVLAARLRFTLAQLNTVVLAAYGLVTFDEWNALFAGTLCLVDGLVLAGTTLALVAWWAVLMYYEGKISELEQSND